MIAAIGLGVGEILVFSGFILAPLALAALVTAVVAAFEVSTELQLAVFAGASVLSLALLRPLAKRHLDQPPEYRTNAAALVDREARVLKTITRDDPGLVRLVNETWTAAPAEGFDRIDEGVHVRVVDIAGATAIVKPIDSPAPADKAPAAPAADIPTDEQSNPGETTP